MRCVVVQNEHKNYFMVEKMSYIRIIHTYFYETMFFVLNEIKTVLEEYQNIIKFALKSFTLTEMGTNIGIVYGFELVPWVYNIIFQITSKVMIEEVIIPLPCRAEPKKPNVVTVLFQNCKFSKIASILVKLA